MIKTLLALGTVLLLATASAGAEGACEPEATTATLETPAGTYYVVNEACQPDDCLFSVWVYEETNGHEGLQREACTDENGNTVAADG